MPFRIRFKKTTEAMRSIAIVLLVLLVGCTSRQSELIFSGQRAYQLVKQQLDFGARHPGTEGHHAVGDWIAEELDRAGWEVVEQTFEYQGVEIRNISGRSDGVKQVSIILGAHYDTRPRADRDEVDPQAPVPGANDSGSGVAVLLELARVLRPESLACGVELVFFDAEDSGGLDGWDWIVGSSSYAASMETEPTAVVIVDMVGDRDLRLFQEGNSDPELVEEIWQLARDRGHQAFVPSTGTSLIDDHIPFLRRGLRAIDIIDFDYAYWHTTEDTLDKVSPDSLAQVGDTLQVWVSACR